MGGLVVCIDIDDSKFNSGFITIGFVLKDVSKQFCPTIRRLQLHSVYSKKNSTTCTYVCKIKIITSKYFIYILLIYIYMYVFSRLSRNPKHVSHNLAESNYFAMDSKNSLFLIELKFQV